MTEPKQSVSTKPFPALAPAAAAWWPLQSGSRHHHLVAVPATVTWWSPAPPLLVDRLRGFGILGIYEWFLQGDFREDGEKWRQELPRKGKNFAPTRVRATNQPLLSKAYNGAVEPSTPLGAHSLAVDEQSDHNTLFPELMQATTNDFAELD